MAIMVLNYRYVFKNLPFYSTRFFDPTLQTTDHQVWIRRCCMRATDHGRHFIGSFELFGGNTQ